MIDNQKAESRWYVRAACVTSTCVRCGGRERVTIGTLLDNNGWHECPDCQKKIEVPKDVINDAIDTISNKYVCLGMVDY